MTLKYLPSFHSGGNGEQRESFDFVGPNKGEP
jgi:hypothetical protein